MSDSITTINNELVPYTLVHYQIYSPFSKRNEARRTYLDYEQMCMPDGSPLTLESFIEYIKAEGSFNIEIEKGVCEIRYD